MTCLCLHVTVTKGTILLHWNISSMIRGSKTCQPASRMRLVYGRLTKDLSYARTKTVSATIPGFAFPMSRLTQRQPNVGTVPTPSVNLLLFFSLRTPLSQLRSKLPHYHRTVTSRKASRKRRHVLHCWLMVGSRRPYPSLRCDLYMWTK